jgi:anti-sigma B factor antagonist
LQWVQRSITGRGTNLSYYQQNCSDLAIDRQDVEDVTVLRLAGRLVLGESARYFRAVYQDAMKNGRIKLVVDCKELVFMNSGGVPHFVDAYAIARNVGGEVVFADLRGRVLQLLEITRLASVFRIFRDTSEALSYFGLDGKEK